MSSTLFLCTIYTMNQDIKTLNTLSLSSLRTTPAKIFHISNADGTTRTLLYNGCSGPTVTIDIISDIFKAHGFDALSLGDLKIIKPHKNNIATK